MFNKKPLTNGIKTLVGCAVVSAVVIGAAAANTTASSSADTALLNKTVLVSAGSNTSQIITEDGNRFVRGENTYGQLGTSNYDSQLDWSATEDGTFTKISAPYEHSLALSEDQSITTWGGNRYSALATGNNATTSTPRKITASSVYIDIASGPDFSVGLDRNGNMFSWGNNASGQLGTGDTKSSANPVLIAGGTTFTSVKVGKNFALAIDSSKHLWAWGSNDSGQLATGNNEDLAVPTLVSNGEWVAIDASLTSETAIGIDINQDLFTWGSNASGQLGNGGDWRQVQADENARVAKQIQDAKDDDADRLENAIDSCAFIRQGETDAWQAEQDAVAKKAADEKAAEEKAAADKAKNNPNSTATPTPTPTPTATPVVPTTPKPTWDQTCRTVAEAAFVPTDTSGMIPRVIPEPALTGDSSTPINIGGGRNFVSAAIGSENGFAIDTSGVLRGWGSDANGQTGLGITDEKAHTQTPLIISSGIKFTQVDAGEKFAAAISTRDSLYVWGSENKASSLSGSSTDLNVPTLAKEGMVSVFLGAKTGYVIDRNQMAYSWGEGANGLLGNNDTANRGEIEPTGQTMSRIAVGGEGAIGLNTSNQLLNWGKNSKGTFGTGETSKTIAGIARNEISKFTDIAAGRFFSLAVDENKTVWAWGYNAFGQTGPYGTGLQTTQPVIVPFDRPMKYVAAGETAGYAVAEDNTVWTWGNNDPAPRQIGAVEEGIKQISAGTKHILVLDEQGNIWQYGKASMGMYNFTANDALTKIEELSTTYIAISAGGQSNLAITTDEQLVGWGDNSSNQLLGVEGSVGTETVLDKTRKYSAVSMGSTHALAVDSAHVVYAWGTEPYGTFSNEVSVVGKPRALPLFVTTEQDKK